nr:MAG TPA: hypothetical protein [Caudoviricetes sp.]DAP21156.1 MAG TPA: hypothetical protein [Caudoviricetes sp.]
MFTYKSLTNYFVKMVRQRYDFVLNYDINLLIILYLINCHTTN